MLFQFDSITDKTDEFLKSLIKGGVIKAIEVDKARDICPRGDILYKTRYTRYICTGVKEMTMFAGADVDSCDDIDSIVTDMSIDGKFQLLSVHFFVPYI